MCAHATESFYLHVCLCITSSVPGATGRQAAFDLLELAVQMAVSHHMGAGPLQGQQCF